MSKIALTKAALDSALTKLGGLPTNTELNTALSAVAQAASAAQSDATASKNVTDAMPGAGEVAASKAETDRLALIKPAAEGVSLADITALALAGKIAVGSKAKTVERIAGTGKGAGAYYLRDAESVGARPTQDGGHIIWLDESSTGLYWECIFENGVTVEQFGVYEASADNEPAFDAAIAYCAANGIKVLKSEAGSTIPLVTDINIGSDIELHNFTFTGVVSKTVQHASNVIFYNCLFDLVKPYPLAGSTKATYLLCRFIDGSYINCGSSSSNNVTKLRVSLCTTTNSPLIYGPALSKSKITLNTVDAEAYGFSISVGGSDNEISSNTVDKAGTTGIIIFPTRTAKQSASLANNKILNNTVYAGATTEEAISLDSRGSTGTNGLCAGGSDIASVSSNTITLSDSFAAQSRLGNFAVFTDGERAGEYYEITAESGGTIFTLKDYDSLTSDVGLNVTIAMGGHNCVINGNTVYNKPLVVWGMWIDAVVSNNNAYNADIRCTSLYGTAFDGGTYSNQPQHGLTLRNNKTKAGSVSIEYKEYSGFAVIEPVNMEFIANKAKNGFIDLRLGEFTQERNTKPLTVDTRYFSMFSDAASTKIDMQATTTLAGEFEIEIEATFDPLGFFVCSKAATDRIAVQSNGTIQVTAAGAANTGSISAPDLAELTNGELNTLGFRRVAGNFDYRVNANAWSFESSAITNALAINRFLGKWDATTTIPNFEGYLSRIKVWTGGDRSTGSLVIDLVVNKFYTPTFTKINNWKDNTNNGVVSGLKKSDSEYFTKQLDGSWLGDSATVIEVP